MISEVFNMDCMEGMKGTPDKFYDLAVVDPEYGIGFSDYERGGQGIKCQTRHTKNGKKQWDIRPVAAEYFTELMRVSKNQIIWGGNYFALPPTQGFIFWYKQNPVPNFSDGEYAWTSFKRPALCFDFRYYGNLEGKTSTAEKIHPTQKPIALYEWIYSKYLGGGGKVLDTHLGSGSNRIAAYKAGNIDFTGYEIDADYYRAQEKRFGLFKSQLTMFANG